MFKTRLLSGIVLMAIIITLNVLGGYYLFAFITAISVIGLYELYKTVKMEKKLPAIICYILAVLIDLSALKEVRDVLPGKIQSFPVLVLGLLGIALILVMTSYVFAFPKVKSEQAIMLVFGLIYVVLFLLCVYLVRVTPDGKLNVWLIYICAWGSDTCAYCVGRLMGKHHLPAGLHELSPKKTTEGCVGGVVGAALIAGIFAACLYSDQNMIWKLAIICAVGAVIGQVGDLAASAIKRNHDIKDYGNLIPGHGGILDRFDSIIFTAPIVFALVSIIG